MEQKIQQKLHQQSNTIISIPNIQLPLPTYNQTPSTIFQSISHHENVDIRTISSDFFHLFQMYFILNDVKTFFDLIKSKLQTMEINSSLDPEYKHGLRFLSNLILLLRNLEFETFQESSNYILLTFITLLQKEKQVEID
jgi:hypothetical protein